MFVTPHPRELGQALRTRTVGFVADPACGVRAEIRWRPLRVAKLGDARAEAGGEAAGSGNPDVAVDTEVAYPAALLPRIVSVLRGGGYRIRFDPSEDLHYQPRPLPEPDLSGQGGLDAAVRLVGGRHRGVILPTEASFVSRILRSVAIAYPGSRFAVVGVGERLETVRRELRNLAARDAARSRSAGEWVSRVVTGTVMDMAANDVGIEHRDAVFFLDASHVASERAANLFYKNDCRYRIFGFLGTDARLSPSERARLLAWYGLDQVVVLGKRSTARTVRTVWCPTRRHVSPARLSGEPLPLVRAGVIRNTDRNRLVARRAAEFAETRPERPRMTPSPAASPNGLPRIAVLTYDHTHAEVLHRLLPGWDVGGTRDADRSIVAVPDCTPEFVAGLDVLVRADGVNGVPDAVPRYVTDRRNDRTLTVVDFRDTHHPQLERRAANRKREYLRRRWWPLEREAVR